MLFARQLRAPQFGGADGARHGRPQRAARARERHDLVAAVGRIGLARHVEELSWSLAKLPGLEVHVVTCDFPGAAAQEAKFKPVEQPLDLVEMGTADYDITAYQPALYRAESVEEVRDVPAFGVPGAHVARAEVEEEPGRRDGRPGPADRAVHREGLRADHPLRLRPGSDAPG